MRIDEFSYTFDGTLTAEEQVRFLTVGFDIQLSAEAVVFIAARFGTPIYVPDDSPHLI